MAGHYVYLVHGSCALLLCARSKPFYRTPYLDDFSHARNNFDGFFRSSDSTLNAFFAYPPLCGRLVHTSDTVLPTCSHARHYLDDFSTHPKLFGRLVRIVDAILTTCSHIRHCFDNSFRCSTPVWLCSLCLICFFVIIISLLFCLLLFYFHDCQRLGSRKLMFPDKNKILSNQRT